MYNFKEKYQFYLNTFEKYLAENAKMLTTTPNVLGESMQYSLFSEGKRIRPVLLLAVAEVFGIDFSDVLPFALAIEMIHTYSLIHDDLPAMDNDDFRRGKPSSHKKFGEANALLAGDALLTHAFALLAEAVADGDISAQQCVRAVKELSTLSGMKGMIGGQYIDLKYENTPATLSVLVEMDTLKTAALIECACALGLIAAGVEDDEISYARDFARELGIAFQITDDVLEAEDENDSSDVKNGKVTYVSLFGVEKARELAAIHTRNSLAALNHFGDAAAEIRLIAEGLLYRKN